MTTPRPSGPRPAGTTGPKALTITGVVLAVAALAVGVVAAVAFVGVLPLGVLAADGSDGEDVVGSVAVGSTAELVLEAESYGLYLVAPRDELDVGAVPADRLVAATSVTGPDGAAVEVRRPSGTSSVGMGGVDAELLGTLRAPTGGAYTVEVDDALAGGAAPDVRVVVVPDDGALATVGGVFTSLGLTFLALLLGAVGLGLAVGGGIWWASRRRATPH